MFFMKEKSMLEVICVICFSRGVPHKHKRSRLTDN